MREQEFPSSQMKKKKPIITNEITKRQENLKAKKVLIETEFSKHEQEKFSSESQNLKKTNELQVKPLKPQNPIDFLFKKFKKILNEIRISKSQKEKALKSLSIQGYYTEETPETATFLLSRPGSQQKEASLAIVSQQKFSSSYAKFLSTTNHSYMSLRNEHNPTDLFEKVEILASDYKKVLHIIEMEKANEVSIRNRISEISKSSIQIKRESLKFRKNIGEIEQRFRDIALLETVAEQKKVFYFFFIAEEHMVIQIRLGASSIEFPSDKRRY